VLEKWNTSSLLQERLSEFGCTVLNYIGDKIIVDYFYSEAMYEKYLSGFDCKQGSGMYDRNQVLVFTRLPDDVMVVVQENGTITEMYKYFTILKATMRYRNTGVCI